jgi:hypothetical protein
MSQQENIEELADSFMLLMSVSGFLEVSNVFAPIDQLSLTFARLRR